MKKYYDYSKIMKDRLYWEKENAKLQYTLNPTVENFENVNKKIDEYYNFIKNDNYLQGEN